MKKYRTDSNGIPIISRTEIEEHAEAFIHYFDKECLLRPRVTPLAAMCLKLKNDHNVNFIFGKDLGETREGYKYRGCFHIPSATIMIDKSLEEGGKRFNFTLAHEIAHFVLHRKINLSILNNEIEIKDTSRDLLLEQIESDNPRTWLEWQANKFASSLLLPRPTIPIAISDKQSEMGVIKNIGKIFLDRGTGSYSDYLEIMEHLSLLYQTSKSAIRIRLRELNILYEGSGSPIEPSDGPAPLNYFLSTIVNNVLDENG